MEFLLWTCFFWGYVCSPQRRLNDFWERIFVFPDFREQNRSDKIADTVYFSSEVDRYISLYGGILSDVIETVHYEGEIDTVHLVAALLWDPPDIVDEFLNLNAINKKRLRRQVESRLLTINQKYEKMAVIKGNVERKNVLRKIRSRLESVCFGQEKAIDTIISQLSLFWSQTPTDRKRRPLSFFFCGGSGTGKSLLADTLRDILSEELGIPNIPTLDMSRFATQQIAIDIIGRDAGWKDGGKEGELTLRACKSPHGMIVVDNYDKGNREAIFHVETAVANGEVQDNFSLKNVSFAHNILIIISNKGASFLQSESFTRMCENNNAGMIPRDKLIDGVCTTIEREDKEVAGFLRLIMDKCDVPVLFKEHTVDSILMILHKIIEKTVQRLETTLSVKTEFDITRLSMFFFGNAGETPIRARTCFACRFDFVYYRTELYF